MKLHCACVCYDVNRFFQIDSKMNGKDFQVGKFSHSLRCYLFK